MQEFKFDFDNFDDISSSSTNNKYEDITSNSGKNYEIAHQTQHNYRKKKHGLAKALNDRYYKIRKWWKCMKKGKRRAIVALSSVILALLVLISSFLIVFRYNYKDITGDPDELGFEGVIDKNIVNIALFGIDSRNTDGKTSFKGNSDSIMILSINTKSKKVKIISLMRDTLVPIEKDTGLTYNKINSAYSWGGPELAIKTLNQNFDLDISEYATVNFYGMSEIIEAVGGIDAELTKDEVTARGKNNHGINDMIQEVCLYEKLNPKDYYVTTPGKQHLNGVQAVAYARIRYCTNIWGTSNDYGRTDRQRYVMEQLFNKAKTMSKKQYVTLAKALIPCTETSLSYSQIMKLAFSVMFSSPTFEQYRVPQNSSDMNFLMASPSGPFGSVVYFDLEYASKLINAIIYDDMTIEEYVEQFGIEKNDWYAKRNKGDSGSYSGNKSSTTKNETTIPPQTESTPQNATVVSEQQTASDNAFTNDGNTTNNDKKDENSKVEDSKEDKKENEDTDDNEKTESDEKDDKTVSEEQKTGEQQDD